jgi:hypothetical protein
LLELSREIPQVTIQILALAEIYGLQVAKACLEVYRSSNILVLGAGQSAGGTWASEKHMVNEITTNHCYLIPVSYGGKGVADANAPGGY